LVYSYEGDKADYMNMKVEIQVRSELQHAWATAVEILSLRHDMNLKASEGDKTILRYMELVAALFALKEGTPPGDYVPGTGEEIVKDLALLDPTTRFMGMFAGISSAVKGTASNSTKSGYYLVELENDTKRNMRRSTIDYFSDDQLHSATELYGFIELHRPENAVVLISAANSAELRKAYPNYFSDAKLFIRTCQEEISKYTNENTAMPNEVNHDNPNPRIPLRPLV
jgi:hypothetical protein